MALQTVKKHRLGSENAESPLHHSLSCVMSRLSSEGISGSDVLQKRCWKDGHQNIFIISPFFYLHLIFLVLLHLLQIQSNIKWWHQMGVLERYFLQAMNRHSLHLFYNRTPFLLSRGLRSARFIILLSGTVIQIPQ